MIEKEESDGDTAESAQGKIIPLLREDHGEDSIVERHTLRREHDDPPVVRVWRTGSWERNGPVHRFWWDEIPLSASHYKIEQLLTGHVGDWRMGSCHRARLFFSKASFTLAGVSGMRRRRTPTASYTAFAMAAEMGPIAPSPTPK